MGKTTIFIAMCFYIAIVIQWRIFLQESDASSGNYLIGGRSLGPWVTAMGAEASDGGGWLRWPSGVAYWVGLKCNLDRGSTYRYISQLALSGKRLRGYTVIAQDSITIPDFLSNRFKEKKDYCNIAALFLIFFTVSKLFCC